MMRLFVLSIALLLPGMSLAQRAVAAGGVNVRAARSSSSNAVAHLDAGDTVDLVAKKASQGYYHVIAADGTKGWAWAARLEIVPEEPTVAGGGAGGTIDPTWKHTATNAAKYSWPDDNGSCAASGSGAAGKFDPETNVWKNRDDEPATYHDVTWDAIAGLEVPRDSTKYRVNWSPTDKKVLARYEGVPVRVVAFLSSEAKQEGKESTNCGETATAHADWHMYLTKKPNQAKVDAIVIEATPRVRLLTKHANWSLADFNAIALSSDSVRVSGW